jgi:hypothetical protein
LQAKGASPFTFCAVRDLDLPTRELEPVVHEARAVHRLDRSTDRRTVTSEPLAQATKSINVRRRCTDVDRRPLSVEQMKIETLAAEIQTGVQHEAGLLSIAPR